MICSLQSVDLPQMHYTIIVLRIKLLRQQVLNYHLKSSTIKHDQKINTCKAPLITFLNTTTVFISASRASATSFTDVIPKGKSS